MELVHLKPGDQQFDARELEERVIRVVEQGKQIFTFSTVDEQNRPRTRYMGVLDISEDYSSFLMATHASSAKMRHLRHNPNALLMFNTPDFLEIATLSGQARREESEEVRRRFWDKNPVLAAYFSGYDDPEFDAILFVAETAEYLNVNTSSQAVAMPWSKREVT